MKSASEMVLEAVQSHGAVEVLLALAVVVEERTLEFGNRRRPNRTHKGNPKDSPIAPERIRGLVKAGKWYTTKQIAALPEVRPHAVLYTNAASFRATITGCLQKRPDMFLCDRGSKPFRFMAK